MNVTASTKTLTARQSGLVVDNLGAAGAVTISLPQEAQEGCEFTFLVKVAQELRIDPGAAGAIYLNGAKGTDDNYITANAISESIKVMRDSEGDWDTIGEEGTWTTE
jgi:hypothetical protein